MRGGGAGLRESRTHHAGAGDRDRHTGAALRGLRVSSSGSQRHRGNFAPVLRWQPSPLWYRAGKGGGKVWDGGAEFAR